jgi:hypothetical protein
MQAMETAGMPAWKLQALMDAAKSRLECDDECLKQREEQRLLNAWNGSLDTLQNSPTIEAADEKAYYVFARGEPAYRKMLLERYAGQSAEWKTKALAKHQAFMGVMDATVADYSALYEAVDRLRELLRVRQRENKALDQAVKQRVGTARADDRRVVYEVQELGSIAFYRNLLIGAYYAMFVLYLVVGDFFKNARYKQGKAWAAIALYAVLPWLAYSLSKTIFYLASLIGLYAETKAPKDIYLTE